VVGWFFAGVRITNQSASERARQWLGRIGRRRSFAGSATNMREVAGDPKATRSRRKIIVWIFGHGYGMGDFGQRVNQVTDGRRSIVWLRNMKRHYKVAPTLREGGAMRSSLREAARSRRGFGHS